jgi:hypothetical protein
MTRVKPAAAMGLMRQEPYWLVFEPFQDEYLPGRRWNREAPQLACQPADEAGDTPTWDAVFNHIGSGLDEDVSGDEVCQSRGILTGSQYLKLWFKLLVERPQQRTPYLFLTSRQNNTGKTSLGASICHLINPGVAEINEEALEVGPIFRTLQVLKSGEHIGTLRHKGVCDVETIDRQEWPCAPSVQ